MKIPSLCIFDGENKIQTIRDLLIISFIIVLFWKLIDAHFDYNLVNFRFTDIIAILLAFFSIALSILFYFKATETSNRFYDNSYKFSKEMSEMLGRIDAGFGERLKHLDEGYSCIRERFEHFPSEGIAKKEIKKGEEEVKRKETNYKEILDSLFAKAQLAEGEKKRISEQLERTSHELMEARAELRERRIFRNSENNFERVLEYIARRISMEYEGTFDEISGGKIQKIFTTLVGGLPKQVLQDLDRYNLVTATGRLTPNAVRDIMMCLDSAARKKSA